MSAADTTGAIAYDYAYYTGTTKYQTVNGYAVASYADPKNPSLSRKVIGYEYDTDGTTVLTKYTYYNDADNRFESKTMKTADASGNVYYHYANATTGVMDTKVMGTVDSTGSIGYYYEYYTGTSNYKKVIGYAEANYATSSAVVFAKQLIVYEYDTDGATLTAKYTYYYASQNLQSKTLITADEYGNVYYHYIDENFNSRGYGRVNMQIMETSDPDGAIAYYYEYYSNTEIITKKLCYSVADYSDPNNAALSGIISGYEYDETGVFVAAYTYYTSGRMATKSLSSPDAQGVFEYSYLDESFYDNDTTDNTADDYGRVSAYTLFEANSKGEMYFTITYTSSTSDTARIIYAYDSAKVLVGTYTYNASNVLVAYEDNANDVSYTYFADSGRMATKTEADGTQYQYYNETFYTNGTESTLDDYGRLYRTYTSDGKTFKYTSYYSGTDLSAIVIESGTYASTTYNYYSAYASGGTLTGYKRVETSSGNIADYMMRTVSGTSMAAVYYKKDFTTGAEYWYLWDETVSSSTSAIWRVYVNLGYKVVVKKETTIVGGVTTTNWYAYLFNPKSISTTDADPDVLWSYGVNYSELSEELQDEYSLGVWPPSTVEYPTGAVPAALYEVENTTAVDTSVVLPGEKTYFFGKLEELKSAYTGADVTIALLDTGIDLSALKIEVSSGYDFAGSDRLTDSGDEDYTDIIGHGTKTASVIKGEDGKGVASDADLMALKVFDDTSSTSSDTVAKAIYYAADNGADILTLSFSLDPLNELVTDAIEYALSKNKIVIVAAGNSGEEISATSLASMEGVITVGALDANGEISSWSNFGDELDILAPWDVVTLDGSEGDKGTSYSAAFVAGVTALLMEKYPDMTRSEILAELKSVFADMKVGVYDEDGNFIIGEVSDESSEEADDESSEIKGASVDEVVSLYEAQRKNQQDFTGDGSIKVEEQFNSINSTSTDNLIPGSLFNPMVRVMQNENGYEVLENEVLVNEIKEKFMEDANIVEKNVSKTNNEEKVSK